MSDLWQVLLSAAVLASTSALLTELVWRYARRQGILDIPNERSAHSVPTPRGGGLAIAVVCFAGLVFFSVTGQVSWRLSIVLLGGGLMVAAIGWLDDRRHVATQIRALVHLLASAWAIYCLGGIESLKVGAWTLSLYGWGSLLAVLSIVWVLNLYNFMDGTDGLAASQAVLAGAAGTLVNWWYGASDEAMVSAVMMCCSLGFLGWNWPPARIFMGDVSSGLIGYWFTALAFAGEKLAAVPSLLWLLVLAPFVADATYTLCWRILRRQVWYAAHRTHAYQQLLLLGFDHKQILVSFLAINVVVCWPLTAVAAVWPTSLPFCIVLLYTALWFVWRAVQQRAQACAR